MRRSVLALPVLLACHLASAQPAMTPPATEPDLSPPGLTPPGLVPATTPAPTRSAIRRKDSSTAMLLSIGITTASYLTLFEADDDNLQILGFFGTYVGPSTGQWYAGQFGGLGLGLRAIGLVSAVYGFSQMLDSECDELAPCSDDDSGDVGALFFFGGAGLWIGSSIYDVVLAKRAADSWNARHGVNVAPIMTSDASGRHSPGLVLSGRF